jgi:hypothetical protein
MEYVYGMGLDLAMLMARQVSIINGDKPSSLEALSLLDWMKEHGKKPGDDCTEYFK